VHFVEVSDINFWAQDNFELLNKDTIIIPDESFNVRNFHLSYKILRTFFKNVVKSPFYFEGGNMTLAKTPDGETVFFIGYGAVIKTAKQLYADTYKKDTDKYNKIVENIIRNFIATHFNTSIFFLGDTLESKNLIHIDQAVLFLDEDNVVLMDYTEEGYADIKQQLNVYEKQLRQLGFHIIKLPHRFKDVAEHLFSLNAILYTHNKRKMAILPVYPGEYKDDILLGKARKLNEIGNKGGIKNTTTAGLECQKIGKKRK